MASIPEGKGVNYITAFIDTSLDTHLAIIVSDVDTVSCLKKRIESEHPLCFPSVGKIQIHAIKVKRRGYFYHLSDSMLVSSAFSTLNRSWFLRVDASALVDCGNIQHSPSPGSSNQQACFDIANNASNGAIDIPLSSPSIRFSNLGSSPFPLLKNWQNVKEGPFSDQYASEHSVKRLETGVKPSDHNDPEIPLAATVPEMQNLCCVNCEIPGSHMECELNDPGQGNKDELNVSVEGICLPSATGKRKSKRKKEHTVFDDAPKETNASIIGLGNDMVQQDIVAPKIPSEDAGREVSYGIRIGENDSANGLCVNSFSNNCTRSSYEIQVSNEPLKEMDVPKEQIESNINTKCDIDIECNESLKEASEPGPSVIKRRRKRKKSLINDSKEDKLKLESASLKSGGHKFDEACKEGQEPKEGVEIDNNKSRNEIDLPCSKLCEEAPDTRSPVKKKLKVKKRSENDNSLMEKRPVVSDSDKEALNPENTSQHSMKDQQKIKDNGDDQSPGHFEDTCSLRSSAPGGKKKRKKKSANPHQTAIASSCRNDDEVERSRIPGEGAILKERQISKDISTSKTAVDNTETKLDACKEGGQSKLRITEDSKRRHVIDMEVLVSDVNKSKDLAEDRERWTYENIVLNHCHKSEHGQKRQSEEKIEMSLQNDPDSMPSEKCRPPNQDHTDTNFKETIVTSKVLDVNIIAEAGKSAKKKQKTRKAKDSGTGENCDLESLLSKECRRSKHVDTSQIETTLVESHKSKICDPTSRNTEEQDNLVNQVGRGDGLLEEIKGNFSSAIDRETCDSNANDVASVEQISKSQTNAENEVGKRRKKSKKKQISATKNLTGMLTKDQVPARVNVPEGHYNQGPLEANGNAKLSTQFSRDDNNHFEVPSNDKDDEDRSIFGQQTHEAIVSDDMVSGKVNATEKTDMELISGRYKHKLEAIEKQTHPESSSRRQPQVMLVKDEMAIDKMNGMERTDIELITESNKHKLEATQGKVHGMLSKDKDDGVRIRSDKKVHKVHRPGPEAPLSSQSNSVTSTIEENRMPRHVNKASGKIIQSEKKTDPFPASNSMLEGSNKMAQNKAGNALRNNSGGVVGKTEKKKSLLAREIAKDESSCSSEDEDEVDSNASTRTPSDNSFSSDYSDGESNANLSSLQNGSYGGKRLQNGGRSAINARSLGTKGMSIDSILRSSSSFKKAKMTASQLEETESQPVDFVPDSQANM